MKIKVHNCIPVLPAVLLAAGVMTLFRACGQGEDGMYMNCHEAQMTVFYISLVMTALSAAGIFIRGRIIKCVFGIAGIIAAVVALLVPEVVIHLCMMNTMRCHALMRPYVIVMSILYIIAECIVIILDMRRVRE